MRAKEILRIPVCVIGGINAANIAQITALNPDYVAVISALYRPASIKENLRNLQAFW
jgi:thiamine-phosphate diphosphorylase